MIMELLLAVQSDETYVNKGMSGFVFVFSMSQVAGYVRLVRNQNLKSAAVRGGTDLGQGR